VRFVGRAASSPANAANRSAIELQRVSKSAAQQRRVVHYQGRVQGVGFRYTTLAIAGRHDVTGFVENQSDGRVRLVCEGSATELERFLATVANSMDRYIENVQVEVEPASNEFSDFTIRH
jgi:acylphosphatase